MSKTLFCAVLVICGLALVSAQEGYGGFTPSTYDAEYMAPALQFAEKHLLVQVNSASTNEQSVSLASIKLNGVLTKIVSGTIYRFVLGVNTNNYYVDVWWQPWNNNMMQVVNFQKVANVSS